MDARTAEVIKGPRCERKISLDDFLFESERLAIERREIINNSNGDPLEARFCDCPELLINGKRLPCPPHHDCDYVRKRSALVPEAERIAAETIGDTRGITNGFRFTREFVKQMEKLAANLSL